MLGMLSFLPLISLGLFCAGVESKLVTIYNNQPRLDVNGDYVDAHDGCIVARNGTYYLFGEYYGNITGSIFPTGWGNYPQLSVYTSPDLTTWTFRGNPLFNETFGTKWIPNVLWSDARQEFVMWGGSGGWFTAVSADGINWRLTNPHVLSRWGNTDGTGFFIDDDGVGYVAYAVEDQNHQVMIERLTPDLLNSTQVNVTYWFPDGGVESPGLWKHAGTYYLAYGSCCCACRGGGGVVIFTAPSITGPWTRQAPYGDVNCDVESQICSGDSHSSTLNNLVYHAQWWGPSFIPLRNGSVQILYTGRRWLSGPGNNASCEDMCGNGGGTGGPESCVTPGYRLATDFDVWHPLTFTANGTVLPFTSLDSYTLDLPDYPPAPSPTPSPPGPAPSPNPPPPGGFPGWNASWVFKNMTTVDNAVCLDGSPPLYWLSPGFGDGANKWQMHHVGGAWCTDPAGCMNWWGWGNTLLEPAYLPPINPQTQSYQYFNRSHPDNAMWNWNYVFMHYCDGYSFISDHANVSMVGNTSVWFRGHAISLAIREDLLVRQGMSRATDVVVGGCSAGGMAVQLQCDSWADSVRALNPATKTRCLMDSGWFPWAPPEAPNGDGFNVEWSAGYDRMVNHDNSALTQDCVAIQNSTSTWLCTMAEVNAPYIKTPMFVFQSQFDGFQIPTMEHCAQFKCTDDNITWWGQNLVIDPINKWLQSPNAVASNSVAFITSCGHHCGDGPWFGSLQSWNRGNLTAAQVFGRWLTDPASVAGMWIQNSTFPCNNCGC